MSKDEQLTALEVFLRTDERFGALDDRVRGVTKHLLEIKGRLETRLENLEARQENLELLTSRVPPERLVVMTTEDHAVLCEWFAENFNNDKVRTGQMGLCVMRLIRRYEDQRPNQVL